MGVRSDSSTSSGPFRLDGEGLMPGTGDAVDARFAAVVPAVWRDSSTVAAADFGVHARNSSSMGAPAFEAATNAEPGREAVTLGLGAGRGFSAGRARFGGGVRGSSSSDARAFVLDTAAVGVGTDSLGVGVSVVVCGELATLGSDAERGSSVGKAAFMGTGAFGAGASNDFSSTRAGPGGQAATLGSDAG